MESICLAAREAHIAPGLCLCGCTTFPLVVHEDEVHSHSMLIEGPKQPGDDINLYLGLLKEELDTLWKMPANTWDAAEKEYFPMRVALLTTVHDYLGYGYLAGQVVHGFSGCVRCMDDTTYRQLDRDPGS